MEVRGRMSGAAHSTVQDRYCRTALGQWRAAFGSQRRQDAIENVSLFWEPLGHLKLFFHICRRHVLRKEEEYVRLHKLQYST
jgi:hypothetical protein